MKLADAKPYLSGGHATFTIQSIKTSKHYTFKVSKPRRKGGRPVLFIKLLVAPDRYEYMGMITDEWVYLETKASPEGHPVHNVLRWLFEHIRTEQDHQHLEFMHDGTCGRCGRQLTTPQSIELGLGPVCAGRV